ncbi:MAG: hypothetical protein ABSC17_10995 [Thermacetogeniaceae bacterium]
MKESFRRSLLLSVWDLWEKAFSLVYQIQEIQPGGLFRLNAHRYRGPGLELQDGTQIRPGDLLGELHLSNRSALKLQRQYSSRVKATIAVKKGLGRDLAYLATLAATGQNTPSVKAYYAITLFHQGMRSLGFEVREFGNPVLQWLYMIGQQLLLAAYHPSGVHRFRQGHQELTSKFIWISRTKLLHDYLPDPSQQPAGNS